MPFEQLNIKNEVYKPINDEADEEEIKEALKDGTCSICLEDFKQGDEIKVLPMCNHVFHPICLRQWYEAGVPRF